MAKVRQAMEALRRENEKEARRTRQAEERAATAEKSRQETEREVGGWTIC